jgi:leucyl-tRNA synthetase
MVNSGPLTGMVTLGKFTLESWSEEQVQTYGIQMQEEQEEAKDAVVRLLKQEGYGEEAVSYRMRDWLVSRQRYWGTPIPIIYCKQCGTVPIPYDQLPVMLPMDVDFRPTGESPLKFHDGFFKTTCPNCGGSAERETDTMDTFVDSSWYQYRYLSPHWENAPFDLQKGSSWLPVDQYMGGAEHATMHLLYSRFWTKVMYDIGLVDSREPFLNLFNQGVILGPDGQKMSKSRGNVVSADEVFEEHGADIARGYLMFIGPWNEGGPYSLTGIEGVRRYYYRVWSLMTEASVINGTSDTKDVAELERALHQTIGRVREAYEAFSFNIALANLMEFTNMLRTLRDTAVATTALWQEALEALLIMLAPIAPHITEELWGQLGKPFSIHQQHWPMFNPDKAKESTFELVLQYNGKVRDTIRVPIDITEDEAKSLALKNGRIQSSLGGQEPKRMVYVEKRLVNVVG